jgi:hypothetical protein
LVNLYYIPLISGCTLATRKRTKKRQDVAETSKRGRFGKALASRGPQPSRHPSHSSNGEDDDCELFERDSPNERPDHYAIKYSKKTKQCVIIENCEAPTYEGSKESTYHHFWSLFHSNWYRSIYLHKKTSVVKTKDINWDWMAFKKHTMFDKIKATCDDLEMMKMMPFKYVWNMEIICQFYATL